MPPPTPMETITSLFITLPNQYSIYSAQSSNSGSYMADSRNIDNNIQALNLQLQDLDRQEQTYDREFLDRKNNPSKKGFFHKIGLRTTEDFVLAYFFFSYVMFFLILFIMIQFYSTTRVYASALVVAAGLIFGFLTLYLMYRYA
jgi:hypothetical protein